MTPCRLTVNQAIEDALDRLKKYPDGAYDFVDGYLSGLNDAGFITPAHHSELRMAVREILRADLARIEETRTH